MNKLLPRRWQKQPQTPVEIDWSHPLAKGLTGLWIFNTPFPINLVNKVRSTSSNAQPLKNSVLGRGYVSSALQLDSNVNNLLTTTNGSIYVGMSGDGQTLNAYRAELSAATSSTNGIYIASSDNATFSNSFYMAIADGVVTTVNSGVQKNLNAEIVFTYGNGSYKAFRKGVLNSSISSTRPYTGAVPLTVQQGFTGITTAGTKAFNAIATWDRTLTDKEAAEASRNIYQLLRPVKQLKLTAKDTALSLDIDFPFPAPTFDAEMVVVEENQTLLDIDLTTSAPDLSAGFLKGELLPLDLPAPSPDIFLDIGQVNRFSMALPMPSIGINMAMETGIVIPISLPLPAPEIESDLVAGQLLNFNLDLPVFDISLIFGEGFAFDVPAPRLEADIRVGNVVSFGLDMPTPNLAIELATERALNIEMPMPAFNLEMAFITGNVVDFALDMPATSFNATVLNGLTMDIALDTSIPDLQAQFGLDGYIDFAFTIPAPMLQADFSSNITSATGRFFNRWTR